MNIYQSKKKCEEIKLLNVNNEALNINNKYISCFSIIFLLFSSSTLLLVCVFCFIIHAHYFIK